MTTGRLAFRGQTPAETLDAIISEEPVAVSAVMPQAPLLVSWIIERCLAKHPADRYGVTADLHRDLRMLRDRLGEAVSRQVLDRSEDRPSLRRRTGWLLATAAALVMATAVSWRLLAEPQAPDVSGLRFTPFATEAGYEGFPAWSPDGQTVAYAAEADGILQIFTRTTAAPTPARITDSTYDARHPFWAAPGLDRYRAARQWFRLVAG